MQQVKSLKEFKLSTSDFIVFNNGRFLNYYDIDEVLGEGIYRFASITQYNDNNSRRVWVSVQVSKQAHQSSKSSEVSP